MVSRSESEWFRCWGATSTSERITQPRRVQEEIVPFWRADGSLRSLAVVADRLRVLARPLEQVCARRVESMVRRDAWIDREVVERHQTGSRAVDHREGNSPAEPHHRTVVESKQ